MAFWWVSQGRTYSEEKDGGFIWAPLKNKAEHDVYHWKNVESVHKNDIVFCYAKGALRAVAVALTTWEPATNPIADSKDKSWQEDGRRVELHYNQLSRPVALKEFVYEWTPLLSGIGRPITKSGKACEGYLFRVSDVAGNFLLEFLSSVEANLPSVITLTDQLLESDVAATTREQLVQSRVGQGLFRSRLLERWDHKCAVTGLSQVVLLTASHIKPWFCSTDAERLDIDNGLLLSPTLDALFDVGLITFLDDGRLEISKALAGKDHDILGLGIYKQLRITPSKKMIEYLEYHRSKVFRN